jgi:hypothetical protein
LNYDDEDDHRQLVAVIGTGLLSRFLDDGVDIRQPLKIDDGAFNRMVVDLRERGLCVIPDSTWVQ